MQILVNPKGHKKLYVCTVCVGDTYLQLWFQNASKTWKIYCERYGLGLIVFDSELDHDTPENLYYKKPNWQKYLIPQKLEEAGIDYERLLFLDADILVNPCAPNIFESCPTGCIGVVSKRSIPMPYSDVLRRIAFYRNTFYSESYPLDSALFISLERLYAYHDLPAQPDDFCSGLFLFDRHNSDIIKSIYYKYTRDIQSITNNGDQVHANYVIQSSGKACFLDYRYQAIWVYEMAWHFPYLYELRDEYAANEPLFLDAIKSTLSRNYFLHFAGRWYETQLWAQLCLEPDVEWLDLQLRFHEYLQIQVTGEPIGMISPPKA